MSPQAKVGLDLLPRNCCFARIGHFSASGAGGLDIGKILGSVDETLQVISVDHRGNAAAAAGQEHRVVSNPRLVNDVS
jgi:hypothetical protein